MNGFPLITIYYGGNSVATRNIKLLLTSIKVPICFSNLLKMLMIQKLSNLRGLTEKNKMPKRAEQNIWIKECM